MPARPLVIHEWRKHGVCSGLPARGYFETIRKARAGVKIPEEFLEPKTALTVSPDEVEDAFVKANPGLSRAGVSVTCSSTHLSEVRICLTRDLKFRDCQEGERRACRREKLVMPPVRGGAPGVVAAVVLRIGNSAVGRHLTLREARYDVAMNYRHAFHAGNFADVVKHAVLARIVAYLKEKPAAFRVIDTHAGAGIYDLAGAEASRTGEWRAGIGKLIAAELPQPVRALLAPYLDAVAAFNRRPATAKA